MLSDDSQPRRRKVPGLSRCKHMTKIKAFEMGVAVGSKSKPAQVLEAYMSKASSFGPTLTKAYANGILIGRLWASI